MARRMMGSQRDRVPFGFPFVLVLWVCVVYVTISTVSTVAAGRVVLIGDNVTLSMDDIEANFAMPVQASGECGVLHVAIPIDGCARLKNNDIVDGAKPPYVLMVRGGCTFEDKVRRAQSAGFQAAIIYNNEDAALVAMAGNSAGINIHAVFISKDSGEMLRKYIGYINMHIWLIPSIENSAWSIMAISFISLLAMSAVLATCFFVRRHRIRRDRPRAPRVREFHGMSSRLVKAMPSLIFTAVLEDNCTSITCAICLEDYSVGEKIRILPCRHKFHAACVDSWLTSWRTFCPVCKRDARTSNGEPPASESTPLLSSQASLATSASFSSIQSSLASSSIQIVADPSSQTRAYSPYLTQSRRSYTNSPMSQSRSSLDLRNNPNLSSSQRSYRSHLLASHSQSQSLGLGYPGLSRYGSAYSSNASPSYVGSSSRQQYLMHCSESATSFSPFTSAQSLPGVDAI